MMGLAWALSFAVIVAVMIQADRRDRRENREADPLAIDPEVDEWLRTTEAVLRSRNDHPTRKDHR